MFCYSTRNVPKKQETLRGRKEVKRKSTECWMSRKKFSFIAEICMESFSRKVISLLLYSPCKTEHAFFLSLFHRRVELGSVPSRSGYKVMNLCPLLFPLSRNCLEPGRNEQKRLFPTAVTPPEITQQ